MLLLLASIDFGFAISTDEFILGRCVMLISFCLILMFMASGLTVNCFWWLCHLETRVSEAVH
jgi:hypothetical protein